MAKRKQRLDAPVLAHFVHAAVCDLPLARQMLRDDPGWLTSRSSAEETALADVAIENYRDAAQFLLEQGADVNAATSLGETPLIFAAQLGSTEMTALLLRFGADVAAQDHFQETALFKAARHGYGDICAMLLQAGADGSLRNFHDQTPMDVILPRKRTLLVEIFERFGLRETSV